MPMECILTAYFLFPFLLFQKYGSNQDEVGKIIIYTTSMRIVRQTFEDCQFVRKLFQNHRVRFEERDLFMNIEYQRELQERLGDDQPITLPIVFIDGALIGVGSTICASNDFQTYCITCNHFSNILVGGGGGVLPLKHVTSVIITFSKAP